MTRRRSWLRCTGTIVGLVGVGCDFYLAYVERRFGLALRGAALLFFCITVGELPFINWPWGQPPPTNRTPREDLVQFLISLLAVAGILAWMVWMTLLLKAWILSRG